MNGFIIKITYYFNLGNNVPKLVPKLYFFTGPFNQLGYDFVLKGFSEFFVPKKPADGDRHETFTY